MTPHLSGVSKWGTTVSFGTYGLKAVENGFVTNRQIEAARKVIVRRIRKIGKLRIRVFPDTPITKSGLEMPMGKGKGEVDRYAARVKRGKILFEIWGVNEELATECFVKATKKLPLKARVVIKGEIK